MNRSEYDDGYDDVKDHGSPVRGNFARKRNEFQHYLLKKLLYKKENKIVILLLFLFSRDSQE